MSTFWMFWDWNKWNGMDDFNWHSRHPNAVWYCCHHGWQSQVAGTVESGIVDCVSKVDH